MKNSKQKLVIMIFSLFFWSGALSSVMSQTSAANSSNSESLSDDQWLTQILPELTWGLDDEDIEVMKKQLSLNDEQAREVKEFNDLVRLLHQSGKEEGNIESLGERSGGKYVSDPEEIKDAKNTWASNYDQLKKFTDIFRKTLGDKEPEFVKWIGDELFIKIKEMDIDNQTPNATAEDIGQEILKLIRSGNSEKELTNVPEYEKWIHDRAVLRAYDYVLSNAGPGKFTKLQTEKNDFYKRVLSGN